MEESISQSHCSEQELQQKLKLTESPFTWIPNRLGFEDFSSKYILLEKTVCKSYNGHLMKYSKYMTKVFELGNQDDPSVLNVMGEWEDFVAVWEKEAMEKEKNFFLKYSFALKYVLFTSKAHLLLKKQDYKQVESLIESIERLNDGSDLFKAGVCGVKAKFLSRYCREGCLKALPFAKEALKFDPDEPKWINLLAKTMRGAHGEKKMKGTEELRREQLSLYKKLLNIKKKGKHLLRLGRSYLGVGHYLEYEKKHRCHRPRICGQCRTIQEYYCKGVGYFKEAITFEPSLYIHFQVLKEINAISRFYSFKFKETARKCVDICLMGYVDSDKDSYQVYYAIGDYYKYFGQDSKTSLEYIKKSADLGGRNAKKDMICIRFNENNSYDPHMDISELMADYECGPMMVQCICQLASYYLCKDDLVKASERILQVKEYDPDFKYRYMRRLRSWFHNRKNVNVLKEVTSGALLKLNEGFVGEEEHQKLANFIEEIKKIAPEVFVSAVNLE